MSKLLYFVFADQDYNECDKDEQEYNEEEHIYTNYTEGTVVWARMSGFPWQVLCVYKGPILKKIVCPLLAQYLNF